MQLHKDGGHYAAATARKLKPYKLDAVTKRTGFLVQEGLPNARGVLARLEEEHAPKRFVYFGAFSSSCCASTPVACSSPLPENDNMASNSV